MKHLILLSLLLSSVIINAQDVVGDYEVRYESSNTLIIDTLTLNADGTFVFHEYDKHDGGVPPERNKYAKGAWKLHKNLIYFSTNQSDFDEKHTLDFNNTKARFISKSPRDKSDRVIETALLFYESEIPWVKGRRLLKK